MVSADPLGGPNLLLGRLGSSHFWHGIDASLADRWSISSAPFPSPPLGGRLRLAGLGLLRLRYKARLWGRCEVDHSAGRLRLRKPERMAFFKSTSSGWSSVPTKLTEARRPKRLLRA